MDGAWFEPAPGAEALAGLDRALSAAGLVPRWRDVDAALLRRRAAAGDPATALMLRLKHSLDPSGVFARSLP